MALAGHYTQNPHRKCKRGYFNAEVFAENRIANLHILD